MKKSKEYGILSRTAEVKWNGTHRKRYEELGYKFTGFGKPFQVKVEHLPPFCESPVRVRCKCGYEREVQYKTAFKSQNPGICKPCANRMNKRVDTRGQFPDKVKKLSDLIATSGDDGMSLDMLSLSLDWNSKFTKAIATMAIRDGLISKHPKFEVYFYNEELLNAKEEVKTTEAPQTTSIVVPEVQPNSKTPKQPFIDRALAFIGLKRI